MPGAPDELPAEQACLVVRGLSIGLPVDGALVPVVEGLDLTLRRGHTLGLVGESGSGKTLTALALMGLLEPPVRLLAGSIQITGQELADADEATWRRWRGARLAIVFQEPGTALNPTLPIGDQVAEGVMLHLRLERRAARQRAVALLTEVGLPAADQLQHAYPHELSGGMRQRVLIAIALAAGPEILIADEPTSALDVTTQGQILALLGRLQRERQMALLLISHNLALVEALCDELAVLYAGRLVEHGPTAALAAGARHPYTRALWATARAARGGGRWPEIPGQLPALGARPSGCAFAPRCPRRGEACDRAAPPFGDGLACYAPVPADHGDTP